MGHTDEDIYAYFSHLSKTLKSQNTYVVADLMMSFMQSQDLDFMPNFVQDVADFKSFVQDYIRDGADRLVGLGEMHLFKFYIDEEGWPVMQCKELAVHVYWLPRDKPAICLWKEDADRKPIIPCGLPNPVPFRRLWGDEVPSSIGNPDKAKEKVSKALVKRLFIKGGILGYIEFWERGMLRKDFPPYIEYWNGILAELEKPLLLTPGQFMIEEPEIEHHCASLPQEMSHLKMTNLNFIAAQGMSDQRTPLIHGKMLERDHGSYSVLLTPKYIPSC